MSVSAAKTIYLKDYQKPEFLIHNTALIIDIFEGYALVEAVLDMERAASTAKEAPLVLHGVDLELELLQIDGSDVAEDHYSHETESLIVRHVPAVKFTLRSRVRIYPDKNTALEGLYSSGGMYCTQCEAEGFRKITYYLDRPDVMARFTTTVRADKKRYPVLLANGNQTAAGELDAGRHFACWDDPFPKPAYLFAMVAGNLVLKQDQFTSMSGRRIDLRIYVESRDIDKVDHAMASLQRCMRWDEEVYGREYDLDVFMIVAVSHFNMGAMENKGLNIFNTSCVLAHAATTSDAGFQRVESVVAHEYFHNWSGNRVTCRDWFQLSLKEGFTVFRDQQFSADMLSPSVQRIEDVNFLRAWQFAEDAGPLAHAVRPESFVEINNFYTATVYEKGSEIVRMLHSVLGARKFRAGSDLYFSRHDGQAVTVEDFVQALADASGENLQGFLDWYRQPGTPTLHVHGEYHADTLEYRLHLRQQLPQIDGFPQPRALPLPVRMALLGIDGVEQPLRMASEAHSAQEARTEVVVVMTALEQTVVFQALSAAPVPSLLRDFSAPVRLQCSFSAEEKLFLLRHDSNGFNRWLIAQELLVAEFLRLGMDSVEGRHLLPDTGLLSALEEILPVLAVHDPALAAKLLQLPSLTQLLDATTRPDPEALHMARSCFRHALGRRLEVWLLAQCEQMDVSAYVYDAAHIAERSLRNTALALLVDLEPSYHALAVKQFETAVHMTNAAAALTALVHADSAEAAHCLQSFAIQWQHEALVMDQWFAIQATAPLAQTCERVNQLRGHADFYRDNPNRVRALIGQFANGNPLAFHQHDGSGYTLLLDEVGRLDALNPQIAARLLGAMSSWRRFDEQRQTHAHAGLLSLAARACSPDVQETLQRLL